MDNRRWKRVALLAALVLTTGCARHTVRTRWGGLFDTGPARQKASKATSGSQPGVRQAPPQPDELLRETFQRQARGAFDPLTDDRRVQSLQTRLRLDPQDLLARRELAGIYERYRLYEEGMEQYLQAVDLLSQTPEPVAGANGPMAETLAVGLGRCARAAGRSPDAIPVITALAKRWPSGEVWNEVGILYDEVGDRASAEQAFRRAVTLQPDSDRLHNNLGYNLLLQDKPEAAEAEFRQALGLNPKSPTAHNNLGAVLARRGDLEGARQQFRLAAVDTTTAHNNLAVVLLEMGVYERSREELVKALSARHYFAPALENFKLVQALLRQRAELLSAGSGLPLSAVHIPPSLLLAVNRVDPPVEPEPGPGKEGGTESNVPEE